MNTFKKRRYIILCVVLFSLAVTGVDTFWRPAYFVKVAIKLVFFLLLPLGYFLMFQEELPRLKKLFCLQKKTLLLSLGLGAVIYGLILGGYFLTKGFIDFSGITQNLSQNGGITKDNFLYVSLYISLMNSLLEEFFFRGFGFLTLQHPTSRKFACLFSASLFAVYHTGMLVGMFDWWVMPILFAGLFAGGYIFNRLDEAGESIYPSWAAHMFANFGINTVGFILFGIL